MSANKTIVGKVVKGQKRGKTLGFPTANIRLHQSIDSGIYLSLVKINKKTYPALTFIGDSKTFNESDIKAESYILNFKEDIYNTWISVRLLKKIRDNIKFKSSKELIDQMQKDKQIALDYFKEHNV